MTRRPLLGVAVFWLVGGIKDVAQSICTHFLKTFSDRKTILRANPRDILKIVVFIYFAVINITSSWRVFSVMWMLDEVRAAQN